jgi:hypothetical protein
MKHLIKKNKLTIMGAGGGPKQQPPPPPPTVTQYPSVLAPPQFGDISSINSFSYAEIIDLISDGPIEGLVNKNGKKIYEENIFEGIYLNDAPIKETSSLKTQKVSISFLKTILKDFWSDNKNTFAEKNRSDNPLGKDKSTSSIDGMVQSVYRTINVGNGVDDIDNANFSSGIKITSYHPKYSSYAYLNLLNASFDVRALLDKAFDLSPIQNENVFLTTIEIPKFTIYVNKTFDPTEGGVNGEYPIKISIPNLGNYIYFSISSDSLNSFNYFEMPRTYAENSVLTAAGQKTFIKTLINSKEFYQYEVFNVRIFIWSIYNDNDGIKNVNDILDKYFNNLIIYQNDPSLYNYNLVQAEFKNGAEIQTPLKSFNKIEIENNIGKELVGAFKLTTSCYGINLYCGATRMLDLSAGAGFKPSYSNCAYESSDDVRYVRAWPIEYTSKGGCPYLICNLYMNYSIYDKSSAARTCQRAVPITHYVSNENVEEVYVTLSLDQLFDTAHVDLVCSNTLNSNKFNQTIQPPSNTPTWSRIQKTDYVSNSSQTRYFLIAGNSINDGCIIDSSSTIAGLTTNATRTLNENYFSAICSSIGLCTKISSIDSYAKQGSLNTNNYVLNVNSPLRCWLIPSATCFIKESIQINGFIGNPTAFELKLKSKNSDGSLAYPFGLSERDAICSVGGTTFLVDCTAHADASSVKTAFGAVNIYVAQYKFYSAPANELKARATVAIPINGYLNWAGFFKYWSNSNSSVSSNAANTIDNLDTLYPNIKRYIVDPFLRYWSSKGVVAKYDQQVSGKDVIGNLYLIGFNKHYLNNKLSFFDSNGKFTNTVLDQLLEEYAFKTSNGETNVATFEQENTTTTDIGITAGLQKVLNNFENGNLIGYSSVYSATKVANFDNAVFFVTVGGNQNAALYSEIQLMPGTVYSNKVNAFTCTIGSNHTSQPGLTTRKFYNTRNIFIVDPAYSCSCSGCDVIVYYQLYSNISANVSTNVLPAPSYWVETRNASTGEPDATPAAAPQIATTTQNITAGTKLPAIVRVMVETGYECKERIEYIGDREYFKYYFDIFGMSSTQSYIDLGRKTYDFVYGEKGSFDSGGYISKTTNLYYLNQSFYLLKVTSSENSINNCFYLLPCEDLVELGDLSLGSANINQEKCLNYIKDNVDNVIGFEQKIGRNSNNKNISFYVDCIFRGANNLCGYDVTPYINTITNNSYQQLDLGVLTTKDNNGCVFVRKIIKNRNSLLGTGIFFIDTLSEASSSEILSNPNKFDRYLIYTPSGFNFHSCESSFTNSGITSLTYGSGFYLAINSGAKLATSFDGSGWIQRESNFDITGVNKVIYGSGLFVAAGNSGKLAISNDALTWTQQISSFGTTGIKALAYGSGIFIAAGESGKLATSTNATSWTQQISSFGTTGICSLSYGSGIFIAVGESGKLARSSNSTTWTQVTGNCNSFGTTGINCVIYGDRFFVAAGLSGKLAYSNNSGTSWSQVDSSFRNTGICTLEYSISNGVYFAGGISGKLASSYNGVNWFQENAFNSSFGNFDVCSIIYKDTLVAGGNAVNTIAVSSDKEKYKQCIQVDSYKFNYSAFENVSVATEVQLKAYTNQIYGIAFYFEESIGKTTCSKSLFNTLSDTFPYDTIVQFPVLQKNINKTDIKVASTLESSGFNWNFQNFIVRIARGPFSNSDVTGFGACTITDFTRDPLYGNIRSNAAINGFSIDLKEHVSCYLTEENILPIMRKKCQGMWNVDDTLNFECIRNLTLNWYFEQCRSNCYFSLYNDVFCDYAPYCGMVGVSKHIIATTGYCIYSSNIRERSTAIVTKNEPTIFNATFWTVCDPNNNTFSIILPTGVCCQNNYAMFQCQEIQTIDAACFDTKKCFPKTRACFCWVNYKNYIWEFNTDPFFRNANPNGYNCNFMYHTWHSANAYYAGFTNLNPPDYTSSSQRGWQKRNTIFLGTNASLLDNHLSFNTNAVAFSSKYNYCPNEFLMCEASFSTSTPNGGPQVYNSKYIFLDTIWREYGTACEVQGAAIGNVIDFSTSTTRAYNEGLTLICYDPATCKKTMVAYKCHHKYSTTPRSKGLTEYNRCPLPAYTVGGGGSIEWPVPSFGDGNSVTWNDKSFLAEVFFCCTPMYVNDRQAIFLGRTFEFSTAVKYYNPSFPNDTCCKNVTCAIYNPTTKVYNEYFDCHRIITKSTSAFEQVSSFPFNDANKLLYVRSFLQEKGIIQGDVKLRNYKIAPNRTEYVQTANQSIRFDLYVNIPFSNVDSDQNNIYSNDAGLAICLPAPKYYSDGTPFRRFVKVTKLSYETLSPLIQKRISLAKITEIIPQKFSYPFSSVVGMKIDSRAFSQIPIRSYDCKLKKILVPSNYFPNDEDGEDVRYIDKTGKYKIYEGDWDGTFKLSWTNNPAWILMDMLVNKRYGLGNFVSSDQIDIWELYKIARWCDGVDDNGYYYGVSDGYGGAEPRHAFNGIITEKFNVFDMINQIAAIFRGHVYYMNSLITFDDDRLKPIIGEFNNSDVKDGIFNYTNLKKDDEYTAVEVAFIDEKDNYKPKIEYVEDSEGIRRRGILKKQINAFGITSKGQARRFGLHFLFQTSKENLNVTFVTDMKALLYKPGDLIGINDELFNSYRNFGKILKIEDISSEKFKITVSPAVDENYIDVSEITLYTPTAKPKYEDIASSAESYPYKLNILTYNIITKTSSNNYVNSLWSFTKSEDRDLINQAYYYTGLISFNYSSNPTVKCNINATLKYEKNYDINNNFSIKYGHWKLFTGAVEDQYQSIYLFDSVSDSLIKNTNTKKQYFFSIFDSGKILNYTGSNEFGEPLYENLSFSMTGGANQPFTISVDNSLGYSSGKINYSQIIENDKPSIENFKIINGSHYQVSGYSEFEISKYGWSGDKTLKIKDSLLDESGNNYLGNLVTGSAFSLKVKNLNQPAFKIMSITENYINEYNILATQYNTDKFKLIEENATVDDLNSTFNFLNAYNSKNNTSTKDFLLKAPIFKSLKYLKDSKGKPYLNIKWTPSEKNPDLIYKIFIQTPSKQTDNFTMPNIGIESFNSNENEYSTNFDLEKSNFEIGTYKVSILAVKEARISSSAIKSISILEY